MNGLVTLAGWTVLHALWQGALVAAGAAVLLRLGRGARPGFRYGVALGALFLVTLLATATALALARWPAGPGLVDAAGGAAAAGQGAIAGSAATAAVVLGALWLLGAALGLSRWCAGIARVRRLRARGVAAPARWRSLAGRLGRRLSAPPARLLVVDGLDSPGAVGWRAPAVLVPRAVLEALPAAQVARLIAHELLHVRRRDYLANAAQALVEALLFFHPATWWLAHSARIEREHCCDDGAAALSGDPVTYARALVSLEALRGRAHAFVPGAGGGSLVERVGRLAAGVPARQVPRARAAVAVAGTVAALAALGSAALPPSAVLAAATRGPEGTPLVRIQARDPAGAFTLTLRGNRALAATIDGTPVPSERLRHHSDSLRILTASGATSFTVHVRPDGSGISWDARPPGPTTPQT